MTIRKQIIFLLVSMLALLVIACHHPQPRLKHLLPDDVILAFGDSLTYGTGASLETSYPADLEKIIGIKVINSGVPGEETRDGVIRIANDLAQYHPKLVILCLGGNDFLHKRSYEEIKNNLRKIIQMIQKSGAQVVLIGVPVPGLSLEAPDFYQELGEELNIPVDDQILPKLLSTPQDKSDYVHLNQEGYLLLAEDIAALLKKQGAISSRST